MIFERSIDFELLPQSDSDLKAMLNYNPVCKDEFIKQTRTGVPGRDPNFTDRAGFRGYDRVFSKYLTDLRYKRNNILEIGTWCGYGLLFLLRYFENSRVYGIDLDIGKYFLMYRKILSHYQIYSEGTVYPADSTSKLDWQFFDGELFDIIIDDGGHHPLTQADTLVNALEYLAPGGILFIEDIDHRYGDDALNHLSDLLYSLSDQYNISIYKHFNTGLDFLVKNNRISNLHDSIDPEEFDATAYIAVIQDTKNGSK
jgi:predicted O-methyltransferase YrrM